MKVTANIATQPHRLNSLMRTIESLAGQVDEVNVYTTGCLCDYKWCETYGNVNVVKGNDKGSAAKFHFLKANQYYLSCDDDIIYPSDYVTRIIAAQKKYGGLVTYHGRRLKGKGLNYYRQHEVFMCLRKVDHDQQIDVPGTGVSCINTNEFIPESIEHPKWRNMDDVAMGYRCAQAGVKVTVLEHDAGWLKDGDLNPKNSIHAHESKNPARQGKLADEIYEIRYERHKVSVIIPYKEDRGWLKDAIESVENQIYSGEIEIIESQSNANVSTNINRGVKMATGKYVKYLCDDDMLAPAGIRDSVKAMKGVDFIHGASLTLFQKSGTKYMNTPKIKTPNLQQLLDCNVINGTTLMYRRDLFEKVGGFDESLTSAEEYEFNLRLLSKGYRIGYCPQVVAIYRRHDLNKSLGKHSNQQLRRETLSSVKSKYINQ